MDLLRVPTRLGFPLLGGSKLRAHLSSQLGLLNEAVPFHLSHGGTRICPGYEQQGTEKKTGIKNTKIQKYVKKEESEGEDQADTWPVGTMTSCRTPLAWLKASIIAKNPTSRLSRSMLSAASSSEKRADVGS